MSTRPIALDLDENQAAYDQALLRFKELLIHEAGPLAAAGREGAVRAVSFAAAVHGLAALMSTAYRMGEFPPVKEDVLAEWTARAVDEFTDVLLAANAFDPTTPREQIVLSCRAILTAMLGIAAHQLKASLQGTRFEAQASPTLAPGSGTKH
jgi:hypothetical protein